MMVTMIPIPYCMCAHLPRFLGSGVCDHRRGRFFVYESILPQTIYFVYTIFAFIYIISAYNYTYSERTPTMPRTVYIGENLERLRLRAALSQIELAKKAGVTPAAVNRIERNRVEPQMRTVRKLAKALDVEPHVLIEGP